jgi:hypothetical protein
VAEVTRGRAFEQKRAEAATWMRKSEVEDGHFWRFQVLTNELHFRGDHTCYAARLSSLSAVA